MLPVLMLVSLFAAAPATQPADAVAVERPMDPWVFRCVLDGEPRRLVVALSDDYFLSYDLDRCVLDKVWKPAEEGGVNLTGTVYDHRHGPQPESRGEVLYEVRADVGWPVEATFLGVSVEGTHSVTLHWSVVIDGESTRVDETPRVIDGKLVREASHELPGQRTIQS